MPSREITTIDCQYLMPEFAAAYLIADGQRAAFVDNNTAHSVPLLMKALESHGLQPTDVEFLIITHVHLDHAGGTSRLAELCPNAVVLAHPRAEKHVIDPGKLVTSARKIYGDAAFEQLYGEIKPIPAARVKAVGDGETVRLGSRPLTFLHTRGHANHHFCIHDPEASAVFTGDSFGLRYPALQGQGLFVFPSTSPTDFDPDEAIRSVDRIAGTGARSVYPTHFGAVTEVREAAEQLKGHLQFSGELLERARDRDPSDLDSWCQAELRDYYRNYLTARGIAFTEAQWDLLKLDLELNGAGIAHVAKKDKKG